jgi:hypothetical protein
MTIIDADPAKAAGIQAALVARCDAGAFALTSVVTTSRGDSNGSPLQRAWMPKGNANVKLLSFSATYKGHTFTGSLVCDATAEAYATTALLNDASRVLDLWDVARLAGPAV